LGVGEWGCENVQGLKVGQLTQGKQKPSKQTSQQLVYKHEDIFPEILSGSIEVLFFQVLKTQWYEYSLQWMTRVIDEILI
jgi:hypothetical protein